MKGTAAPWRAVGGGFLQQICQCQGTFPREGPRSRHRSGSIAGSTPSPCPYSRAAPATSTSSQNPGLRRRPATRPLQPGCRAPRDTGTGTLPGLWVPGGCLEPGTCGQCLLRHLLLVGRAAARLPKSPGVAPSPQPRASARHGPVSPEPTGHPATPRREGAELTGCIFLMQLFYELFPFWDT